MTPLLLALVFVLGGFAGAEDPPLSQSGGRVTIPWKDQTCTVTNDAEYGAADQPPKRFALDLSCAKTKQRLWTWDGQFWDEPGFRIDRIGDFDKDNRVDFTMVLAPKYSMPEYVLYLSTKAKPGGLVGLAATEREAEEYLARLTVDPKASDYAMARSFVAGVRACLDKQDAPCLSRYLPGEVYFPEREEYGCSVAASPRSAEHFLSAADYARCVMSSNLYQSVRDCFDPRYDNATIESVRNGSDLASGKSGGSCAIRKDPEIIRLGAYSGGC